MKPTETNLTEVNALLNGLQFTEAERQEWHHIEARQYVCMLFGWLEEEYFTFQYNAGHNYLIFYFNNDAGMVKRFLECPAFWQWWNNIFGNLDVSFMEDIDRCDRPMIAENALFNAYLQIHDSRRLAGEIYPGPFVWKQINGRRRK